MKKLLLLLCLLVSGYGFAQTAVPVGGPFEFEASTTSDSLDIPVKLDRAKAADIQFEPGEPFSVRNGSSNDSFFRQGIRVKWDAAASILHLKIETEKLFLSGNYEVNLRYRAGTATDFSYFNFILLRAAPVVEVGKIIINLDGHDPQHNQLTFTETSGKAGLVGIQASDPSIPEVKEKGAVYFPASPVTIKPGEQVTVNYGIKEKVLSELPLGSTIGKMQFRLPNVAMAPLQVQIEIVNKRSRWWIVALVFGGLFMGALVRHYLNDRREVGKARLDGAELISTIRSATQKIKDEPFRQIIENIVSAIDTAISPTNKTVFFNGSPPITTEVDKQRQAFNTALSDIQKRIADAQASYRQLEHDVFNIDNAPQTARFLKTAKDKLHDAAQFLDGFYITKSETALKETETQGKQALDQLLIYLNNVLIFLANGSRYLPAPSTPPDPNQILWLADIDTIKTLYTKLTATAPADLHAALLIVNQVLAPLNSSLDRFNKNMPAFYAGQSATAAQNKAFQDDFQRWLTAINDVVQNPDNELNLSAYWQDGLKTELDSSWAAALPTSTVLGGSPRSAFPPLTFARQVLQWFDIKSPGQYLADPHLQEIDPVYTKLFRQYLFDTTLQLVLLTLLIGLAGYLSYGAKFIGTPDEMITIFLFSFSLDITADSVNQLRTRV